MPENQNPENTNESEDDSSPNIRRMRDRIKELEEANKLKDDALRMAAFQSAGVDPEAPGLGKAVFRTYEGPSDPAAIVEFAKQEYGWEPNAKPRAEVSPEHQRLASADRVAVPESPARLDEEVTEAEQAAMRGEMDWMKVLAKKTQMLRQISQAG